jgi:cbb3-type cytochrome oxidase subunit 3
MGKFKEIFESTSADLLSSIALVIFFSVFLLVTLWVLTRKRKTVNRWASIPLHDDPNDPIDPRPRKEKLQGETPSQGGPEQASNAPSQPNP